ncbi:MAG: FAD:protein FMN transferase [Planctomycetota bacterium]|nr:FAD:protein FMN transferase [Planctomycetota bacterium]
MPKPTSHRREFLKGKAFQKSLANKMEATQASHSSKQQANSADSTSYLLHITRKAMACDFQVFLNAGEHQHATEASVEALDLIEEIEDILSIYRQHTSASQLNQLGGTQAVRVHPILLELLKQATELWQRTDGAFDITSTALSKLWGFHQKEPRVPSQNEIQQTLRQVSSEHLIIHEDGSVQFGCPELQINLGSIGKGYALDRCHQHFVSQNLTNYLLHGGLSSVFAHGQRFNHSSQGLGWQIGLRHPLVPDQYLAHLWLDNVAAGTSGDANQFFYHQGQRYGHILDPRTGYPVQNILSATAFCPTAAEADALATAFYVMGPEQTAKYCQQHNTGFLLVEQGKLNRSTRLHAKGLSESQIELIDPSAELVFYE